MSSAIRVTGLFVYPIKSCGGTALQQAKLGARGIEHDREFMLVGPDHWFLTQRELPRLTLIHPTLQDGCLQLDAPGLPSFQLAPRECGDRYEVTVWRDTLTAIDQGNAVSEWFSTFLSTDVRLVRMPSDVVRRIDPAYAPRSTDQVGFADGYPALLISEESLADLNGRLAEPLPMNRFRPNIVVRGTGDPYAEDTWATIRVGPVPFDVVKACARCAITTTDQVTATRGPEPLVTLATYRRVPRGVLFGQNLVHAAEGVISIGDALTVCAQR
jgi:MOSC domain-containing protein